jgi:hypothetical protein
MLSENDSLAFPSATLKSATVRAMPASNSRFLSRVQYNGWDKLMATYPTLVMHAA